MAPKENIGPDKELINLAFRLKPVMTCSDGYRRFLQPLDLYEKLWGGEMDTAARDEGCLSELCRVPVKLPVSLLRGLVDAPTMAQVLPQIPKEYLETAVAFEVRSNDGDYEGDNGFVQATATLYKGVLPPVVRDQPVRAWKRTYTAPFPPEPASAPEFNKAAATTLDNDVKVLKPLQLKKPEGPGEPRL